MQVCVVSVLSCGKQTLTIGDFITQPSSEAQLVTRSHQGEEVDMDMGENVAMPVNDGESLAKFRTYRYNL